MNKDRETVCQQDPFEILEYTQSDEFKEMKRLFPLPDPKDNGDVHESMR